MALIPLPTGLRSVEGLPRLKEQTFNLMNIGGLISRPGIDSWVTGSGLSRGSFMYREQLHKISDTRLLRISSSGVVVDLGEIVGNADVVAAVDFAAVALVVKGGKAYKLVGGTLTENTNTNYLPSDDVTVIDGRFVYIPTNGSPAFFSEVGVPDDIDPLSFFDAETSPDLNTGASKVGNDLIIHGAESAEIFRHIGPDSAPFVRVVGGSISIGYFGGRVKYRIAGVDTVCFVGRDEGGGFGIFNPQGKISNGTVDEILQDYSEAELKQAVGNRFTWNGADCLVFSLVRHTFVYNGADWTLFGSGFDGGPWDVKDIIFAYGRYVVGTSTDAIGRLADVDDDFDNKIDRYFDTFYRGPPQTNFTLANIEAQITFRRKAGTLGLSLSPDGVVYGPTFWRDTPAAGNYTQRVVFDFPGGLGSYDNFAGIRIRSTERVTFNTDALYVDDGT